MARHAPKPPPPDPERRVAVVMSVLGAIGFGVVGAMAIVNRSITLPGRSGAAQSATGSSAEMLGWLLLAGCAACLSHLAMALKPGRPGVKWMAAIFAVWAAGAATHFFVHNLR